MKFLQYRTIGIYVLNIPVYTVFMDIMLAGTMGRDVALAERLQHHRLHIVGAWHNPDLVHTAEQTSGTFQRISSITDVTAIADYAEVVRPDMFVTNSDDALACGVVDELQRRTQRGALPELLIPCPDQQASRIEWDKFYLREIIAEIDPSYNPLTFMATTASAVDDAIHHFMNIDKKVVIKPRGLTGGKGVKVQGEHMNDYQAVKRYAHEVLMDPCQEGLEVQEKLEGHEFTLQFFTDGTTLIQPPETYDHPYREDGDTGPGTGGTGVFSMQPAERLPFISQADYDNVVVLMDAVLANLKQRGIDYKGVLYPTFFKTSEGLKIVEINARGGDPELVNILDLMDDAVDIADVLQRIANEELRPNDVRFKQLASCMIYLMSPDYGYRTNPSPIGFNFDVTTARQLGTKVRFAAAEHISHNHYRTVGTSRTLGLCALGVTPWEARAQLHDTIAQCLQPCDALDFRRDIGDRNYIEALAK